MSYSINVLQLAASHANNKKRAQGPFFCEPQHQSIPDAGWNVNCDAWQNLIRSWALWL